MLLRDLLQKVALEYPEAKNQKFTKHPLGDFVRNKVPVIFNDNLNLNDTNFVVRGSVGQSRWSDVPWIAVMNKLITSTTKNGYYAYYSFSADGKSIYLGFGQGLEKLEEEYGREWKKVVRNRAESIKLRAPEYSKIFSDKEFDLLGTSHRAKSYPITTAFQKKYDVRALPSEETLLYDIRFMLKLYNKLIFEGEITTPVYQDISNKSEQTLTEEKKYKLHRVVEGRVNTKKVKEHHGYHCQTCDFDFKKMYGILGEDFIEAHHLVPFSKLAEGELRKLNIRDDFAVLCANCHRMIHRLKDSSNLSELRAIIKASKIKYLNE